ncbi:DMT family transporter [Cohnella candidum]|uniref:DMT family transporter n=1 Tax=Cohnella candidum TaxID=2674991 RepID=A0A3G3JVM0_9BACL|nr:DMT family transporter [Cohnella candidum]AYQ72290.1 DMT family transporter [Cohnella candidum]
MNRFKYYALVMATTCLMGVAFPVGKMGLAYAPPFLLMAVRFLLAGGALALFAARKGTGGIRGERRWLKAAVIGLLQSAGVMGCAYYSMHWISSGESAILTSAAPLLVIVLGSLLNGAAYRSRQWLGVAVGFAGVALTFGFHVGFVPGTYIGFAGAVCFAFATLLVNRWGAGFDSTVLAAYQMLFGGVFLLLLSFLTEPLRFALSISSVVVLLWLAIMCSIVQFTLWFYLLRHSDPGKTSVFLFLVPVFGVLSSWLLLGEKVGGAVAAGAALICFGIYLVNGGQRRRQPAGLQAG